MNPTLEIYVGDEFRPARENCAYLKANCWYNGTASLGSASTGGNSPLEEAKHLGELLGICVRRHIQRYPEILDPSTEIKYINSGELVEIGRTLPVSKLNQEELESFINSFEHTIKPKTI